MRNYLYGLSKNYSQRLQSRVFSTHLGTYKKLPSNSPITRVRIWHSGYLIKAPSADSNSNAEIFVRSNIMKSMVAARPFVGHVSLETKELYASLWPADDESISLFNKYKSVRGQVNSAPALDEQIETRPPDILIDLYTLNVGNIKICWDQFLVSDVKYKFLGRSPYLTYYGTNNCCGLAYDLLKSGGIDELTQAEGFFLQRIVVSTPNYLAKLVQRAESHPREKKARALVREQEIAANKESTNKPR